MEDDYPVAQLIRRAARVKVVLLAVLVLTIAGGALFSLISLAALLGIGPGAPLGAALDDGRDWTEWAAQTISSLATIFALCHLVRMLGRGASGDIFSSSTGGNLRGFARWICVGLAAQAMLPLLVAGADHLLGLPHSESISISGSDILLIIASVVFYEIAGLLDFAHLISLEYRQIV